MKMKIFRKIRQYFEVGEVLREWVRDNLEECKGLLVDLEGVSLMSETYRAETLANRMCILMIWDRTKKGIPREFYDQAVEAIRATAERGRGDISRTMTRLEEKASRYFGRAA